MFAYMYRLTVDGEKFVLIKFIELFMVLKFEAF